jgi:hypothetical protein
MTDDKPKFVVTQNRKRLHLDTGRITRWYQVVDRETGKQHAEYLAKSKAEKHAALLNKRSD